MRFKRGSSRAQMPEAYSHLKQILAEAGIELNITRKRVKNINFRLKPNRLSVSAPHYASDNDIVTALSRRIEWAIAQHASLLKRQRILEPQTGDINKGHTTQPDSGLTPIYLWGAPQSLMRGEEERVRWYRQELQQAMPRLFAKWQPIVGAYANETRIKKMKTRWGSCNTRAKRVWLSVYLPAYPIECTEYVIVHELCHLHHPNHSPAFWAEVERAMPDYKRWHNMLAGKSVDVD